MNYKGYKGIEPTTETLNKWLLTRKRSEGEFLTFGDFKYSGFYTVQNYRSDRLFFRIAFILEILFLFAVSIMVGGFDLLLSLSAFACIALDFIGAYFYHKNSDKICKAQLALNIEKYNKKIGRSNGNNIGKLDQTLKSEKIKASRIIGATLILFSALLKIVGSFILFELPVFTIALTFIYCFVAYIHIYHTGYWFAGWRFFSAMDKQLISELKVDPISGINTEFDFDCWEVENLPAEIKLKEIRYNIFKENNIYDSLQYNKEDNKWSYHKWHHHFWDDADLINFINSKDDKNGVLTDAAKAFIAADISQRKFLNVN